MDELTELAVRLYPSVLALNHSHDVAIDFSFNLAEKFIARRIEREKERQEAAEKVAKAAAATGR
jgi:hypothetical protein